MASDKSKIHVDPIIAHRKLYVMDDKNTKVVVSFGKPRKEKNEGDDYLCPYKIESSIMETRVGSATGIDEVQALILALNQVGSLIEHLNLNLFNGRLRWLSDDESPNENLGFPHALDNPLV